MRTCARVIAGCLALAILVPASGASATEIKAIWVWEEETFRLLDDPSWRDEVLARLGNDGFNTLYLYADAWNERASITDERALYEELIRTARKKGFRVEALLGSAHLGTNRYVLPDKRDAARAMIERVISYNQLVPEYARFDAIHLDIEPYTLPEWKTDRTAVIEHFVDAAREWRQLAHRDGTRTEIGAAIPFWFDGVKRKNESLLIALLEAFDYVALMAYRDKAEGRDGIIEHSRYEVAAAGRLGRNVVIGVDTGRSSVDKLTFAEEGRDAMERELAKVRAEFLGHDGYAGLAVHHLESYLLLD